MVKTEVIIYDDVTGQKIDKQKEKYLTVPLTVCRRVLHADAAGDIDEDFEKGTLHLDLTMTGLVLAFSRLYSYTFKKPPSEDLVLEIIKKNAKI